MFNYMKRENNSVSVQCIVSTGCNKWTSTSMGYAQLERLRWMLIREDKKKKKKLPNEVQISTVVPF